MGNATSVSSSVWRAALASCKCSRECYHLFCGGARAFVLHAQVTAVPVSRQGSGVSVHELRLPSHNGAAACRVDGRCGALPQLAQGLSSPHAGTLSRRIIAPLMSTMAHTPDAGQVLLGVLRWGAAITAQHSDRRHGCLATRTSPLHQCCLLASMQLSLASSPAAHCVCGLSSCAHAGGRLRGPPPSGRRASVGPSAGRCRPCRCARAWSSTPAGCCQPLPCRLPTWPPACGLTRLSFQPSPNLAVCSSGCIAAVVFMTPLVSGIVLILYCRYILFDSSRGRLSDDTV